MASVASIRTDRLGEHVSRGTELLYAWLKRERVSRKQLADIIGCGATTLDRLVHGDRPPIFRVMIALQTECHIPLAAWSKPASARFLKSFRTAAKAA